MVKTLQGLRQGRLTGSGFISMMTAAYAWTKAEYTRLRTSINPELIWRYKLICKHTRLNNNDQITNYK
jgi:hypothetical protein